MEQSSCYFIKYSGGKYRKLLQRSEYFPQYNNLKEVQETDGLLYNLIKYC